MNMCSASARNWNVLDSVILVFLSNDRLNWLIPSPRTELKREFNVRKLYDSALEEFLSNPAFTLNH